jgi:DNA replication protein DnaC
MSTVRVEEGAPYPCAECGTQIVPRTIRARWLSHRVAPERCDRCRGVESDEDKRQAALRAAGIPAEHVGWCWTGAHGTRLEVESRVRSTVSEALRRTTTRGNPATGERETVAWRSLWLEGPVGTGKSTLASALLRTIILRPDKSGFSAPSIAADGYAEVRRERGAAISSGLWLDTRTVSAALDDKAKRAELTARARACGLLVFDDLGQEATAWCAREICEVLEHRHTHRLATIITSNTATEGGRPFAGAAQRMADLLGDSAQDERLRSRWVQQYGEPVVLRGEDRRTR